MFWACPSVEAPRSPSLRADSSCEAASPGPGHALRVQVWNGNIAPLGTRAIPEIIVGPYPVGFDTMAFYVSNTLDWAAGRAGFLETLGTAPCVCQRRDLAREKSSWAEKIVFKPSQGPLEIVE